MSAPARPVATLGRRYHLCASHRLHAPGLSAEANTAAYGKCNHPYGHGHNYMVEVALRGPLDARTGMVADLAALDAFAQAELLDRFDHTNLNESELFRDRVPSTEHLAMALYEIFARFRDPRSPCVRLERVHVRETANNSFDYAGAEPGLLAGRTQ